MTAVECGGFSDCLMQKRQSGILRERNHFDSSLPHSRLGIERSLERFHREKLRKNWSASLLHNLLKTSRDCHDKLRRHCNESSTIRFFPRTGFIGSGNPELHFFCPCSNFERTLKLGFNSQVLHRSSSYTRFESHLLFQEVNQSVEKFRHT